MQAEQAVTEDFATFDHFSEEELSNDAPKDSGVDNDDWSKDVPELEKEANPKKEEIKDDLKVIKDSHVDEDGELLDDDEEKAPKKEEKPKAKEEKPKEEESKEEKLDTEDEVKPEVKKLRMRMGDELFNVDSNATFKVKVDGEQTEVPLQELINNYSGKTAWDKKFTEIGKEKKALEASSAKLQQRVEYLNKHMGQFNKLMTDPNANPMEAMLLAVEMAQGNPYTTYRRFMEANLEELGQLLDMTETERELYFHKKKDEFETTIAKKRESARKEEETFNQVFQKVEQLRKSYNVSEDEFVDASEELEALYKEAKLDPNQISEETIVEYASLKPHISKVKTLIEKYEDNISEQKYGDVVSNLARQLRDGELSEKQISELLKRNFSVEEDVKELNTKVYAKQESKKPAKVAKDEVKEAASFDDFDV
jgi:hypothetical protein